MEIHVANYRIKDISHKLSLLGEPLSEKMIITKILMTLSPSLAYLSAAWKSTPITNRTVDNLIIRLLTEEARLSLRESEIDNALSSKIRDANNEAAKKNLNIRI